MCVLHTGEGRCFTAIYPQITENHIQKNLSLAVTQKEEQKLVFKTDYRLMHVKSIAECSLGAFCNTFDLH